MQEKVKLAPAPCRRHQIDVAESLEKISSFFSYLTLRGDQLNKHLVDVPRYYGDCSLAIPLGDFFNQGHAINMPFPGP